MKKNKQSKYHTYKRGQIIMANFTPSIGSELRGQHFAIVLTKKDSPKNGVLTVIPLSSKKKSYYLDIGNIVGKQVLPVLLKNADEIQLILQELENNALTLNEDDVNKMNKTLKDFITLADSYVKKNKRSYALVQNIITISKYRIKTPQSRYDPLKSLIIDDLLLDLIDKKILELFVNTPHES